MRLTVTEQQLTIIMRDSAHSHHNPRFTEI
jgi:hypothetical protein